MEVDLQACGTQMQAVLEQEGGAVERTPGLVVEPAVPQAGRVSRLHSRPEE